MEYNCSKRVEIYSINYDFLQSIPYSQKVLWVQLRYPAPSSLRIGDTARIVSRDRYFNPQRDAALRVVDIVGTRVALSSRTSDTYVLSSPDVPFSANVKRDGRWHPQTHSDGTWGYTVRNISDQPYAYRNWTYGNGRDISYLEW